MIRILYAILFYLIYRITDLILLVVMLVQMGLSIFSGEPSASIKAFGKSLGVYLQQISEFLSYASEEKPFPFSDWPESDLNKSETSLVAPNLIAEKVSDSPAEEKS